MCICAPTFLVSMHSNSQATCLCNVFTPSFEHLTSALFISTWDLTLSAPGGGGGFHPLGTKSAAAAERVVGETSNFMSF